MSLDEASEVDDEGGQDVAALGEPAEQRPDLLEQRGEALGVGLDDRVVGEGGQLDEGIDGRHHLVAAAGDGLCGGGQLVDRARDVVGGRSERSEEHTSELQSLMRISYAVFCLKKK